MHTTLNYSPNFETKKRKKNKIKFIVLHYTGMKKESEAIERLTNINSKVSSHYLIKNNGEIVLMVPDLYPNIQLEFKLATLAITMTIKHFLKVRFNL